MAYTTACTTEQAMNSKYCQQNRKYIVALYNNAVYMLVYGGITHQKQQYIKEGDNSTVH